MNYISVIVFLCLFFGYESHRYGESRLTNERVEKVIEKYLSSIKKLTDDFPNHQIEVHLDIAGDDQNTSRPQRRFNYIHLRKPVRVIGHHKPRARLAGDNESVIVTPLRDSPPLGSSGLPDPDMQPVYMKDLKKAIEELDRKYWKQIEKPNLGTIETRHQTTSNIIDGNMKEIMRLLERGTLVGRNIPEPTDKNLSWLQIKIPKK